MKTTLHDIAKRTDLSIATVSRVLNNSSLVAESTRKKVEEAIQELHYKSNYVAWNLARRNLNTIGLIMPDITNAFYPAVIRGLEDELFKNNYNLFLCNTDENIEEEKLYIHTLLEKGVEGIIFLGTRPTDIKNDYLIELSRDIPVLMINDFIIGSGVYSVMTDEVEGAYKAVKYLIDLGHKRIGFINGNVDYTTYSYKAMGYSKAHIDNTITSDEMFTVKEDPHELGGYKGAKQLMQKDEPPTAIFCASDQIAVGCMKGLYELGYRIPDEVSIIGFSNSPISQHLYPGLTTINQFPYKTGKIAATLIIDVLNEKELDQRKIILETELVIRESCSEIIE